ncbi:MAG: molybdate ABC transporter permease subunit [Kofleriaceae bacterium]|nr:molybdate ABC transporter permease subunit [Kofleriaceae bacterium]MBP6836217.1 molybdate ABC transporter permease subunit [Kofleriaceae bacterium]MBP9205941.1 molybdate ABC transporter permease subunit [Kofleriaceae bacterium]
MEWAPLVLSLKIATIATVFTVVLGVGLGALLAWPRLPGRNLLDAILTAPMVLPPTVLGYYVLVTVGKNSWIEGVWQGLFGTKIVFTFTGAVVAAIVGSLPFVIKAARTAFEELDPTLVAAARTLGAGPVRIFWTIRLPLARAGLLAGAMLGWAKSLGDFGITMMVIGSRVDDVQPASIFIYDAWQGGRDGAAQRMVLAMTAVAIVILFVVNHLSRRSPGA